MCAHDFDYSVQANKSLHYILFFSYPIFLQAPSLTHDAGSIVLIKFEGKPGFLHPVPCHKSFEHDSPVGNYDGSDRLTNKRFCSHVWVQSKSTLSGVEVEKSVLFVHCLLFII